MMSDLGSPKSIPRIIYVMGIDGSGKTTIVEWLAQELGKKGYDVDILWLRFNHFFTKPLLAFCRLTGLTKYENIEGFRVGYHDFYRSKVVSWLFVFFQYLDALRVRWMCIAPRTRKKSKVLILDRYIYDILIDIMIDTGMDDLHQSWAGEKFIRLLPEDALVLPVIRGRQQVLDARPESKVDKNFDRRFQMYNEMPSYFGQEPLENIGSLEDIFSSVAERVGINR